MKPRARRKKKRLLIERDGLNCHYCRKKLTYRTATMDHKIPRSVLPGWDTQNLVLSCEWCNRRKADLHYETFLTLLALESLYEYFDSRRLAIR